MDRERKRRRAEKVEASRVVDQMKGKGREEEEEEKEVAAQAAPPPTEEEVEEFFAILRRMRVAVKYFEKEGIHSKSGGVEPPRLPTVVDAAADGGGKRNSGLDLNAVPEAESSLL